MSYARRTIRTTDGVALDVRDTGGEGIPGSTVHIFPRDVASSHFPFLQNPAAFNAVLLGFLQSVDADACDIRSVQ